MDSNGAPKAVQDVADIATDKSDFISESYVKGIAQFIKECATPMTISIQGDWGVGKTSLFNLIEKELRANADPAVDDSQDEATYCESILGVASVDIWHYAVSGFRNELFETLLSGVIDTIAENSVSAVEKLGVFALLLSSTFDESNDKEGEEEAGSIIEAIFGPEKEKPKSGRTALFENGYDVDEFKRSFAEAVAECAGGDKPEDSRFVIFVDGLDHVEPEIAIDLLESIKSVLECAHCVFVFAVDEQTVFKGVLKKYADRQNPTAAESRKKLLFDKLIQVPLRIPASAFNQEAYIKNLLAGDEEQSDEFIGVINTLLNKHNPRSIKRYINTMSLYQSILDRSESEDGHSLAMLFAAVILRVESDLGFNAIASCTDVDETKIDESIAAALEPLELDDAINWTNVPNLWHEGENADDDANKRRDFLYWVRRLK